MLKLLSWPRIVWSDMVKSVAGNCCIVVCKLILVISLFELCGMNCCIINIVMGCKWNVRECWEVICTLKVELDFVGENLCCFPCVLQHLVFGLHSLMFCFIGFIQLSLWCGVLIIFELILLWMDPFKLQCYWLVTCLDVFEF